MSAMPQSAVVPFAQLEQLREARSIIAGEGAALGDLARRLDTRFCEAVELLVNCRGAVIVTGIGKAGLIGQKIVATLCSTGTRAYFLHPTEALHGDLGCVSRDDVLLALSNSGETEEVLRLAEFVRSFKLPLIAITAIEKSALGGLADIVVTLGRLTELGMHGLAPSTSTTAMLAVGDALALVASKVRGFTPQQFAALHPAGSLGRKLTCVKDVMRSGDEVRVAQDSATVRDVFISQSRPGRRTGAVMLTDADGLLTGIFTDSDLARLLEHRRDESLDRPISEVMTRKPLTVPVDALVGEVWQLLGNRHISELPVIDPVGYPQGLIDITDLIGLMP